MVIARTAFVAAFTRRAFRVMLPCLEEGFLIAASGVRVTNTFLISWVSIILAACLVTFASAASVFRICLTWAAGIFTFGRNA